MIHFLFAAIRLLDCLYSVGQAMEHPASDLKEDRSPKCLHETTYSVVNG